MIGEELKYKTWHTSIYCQWYHTHLISCPSKTVCQISSADTVLIKKKKFSKQLLQLKWYHPGLIKENHTNVKCTNSSHLPRILNCSTLNHSSVWVCNYSYMLKDVPICLWKMPATNSVWTILTELIKTSTYISRKSKFRDSLYSLALPQTHPTSPSSLSPPLNATHTHNWPSSKFIFVDFHYMNVDPIKQLLFHVRIGQCRKRLGPNLTQHEFKKPVQSFWDLGKIFYTTEKLKNNLFRRFEDL